MKRCRHCGKTIRDEAVLCPFCHRDLPLADSGPPQQGGIEEAGAVGTTTCPFCAEDIRTAAIVCKHCGRDLAPAPQTEVDSEPQRPTHTAASRPPSTGLQPSPPSFGDGVNLVIPYKNPKALIAYYLGVFAIVPCLGLPMGIAAFVLGIMGLKYAKENAQARGRVHAWVGILAGGLFSLVWGAAIVTMLLSRR